MALRMVGFTLREIGKQMGRSPETIREVITRYEENGSINRIPGSGRFRKTTPKEDNLIVRQVKKNRRINARQIKEALAVKMHENTIRKRIREIGMFRSHWTAKKPFISEKKSKTAS